MQEAVLPLGNHKGTLIIEYDDISMKTRLTITRFGSTFGTLRFVGKSFFNTLLGFIPCWDHKPTNAVHADSLVYNSEKFLNLSTITKIHLKCDDIDGSVVIGLRQFVLFSFFK